MISEYDLNKSALLIHFLNYLKVFIVLPVVKIVEAKLIIKPIQPFRNDQICRLMLLLKMTSLCKFRQIIDNSMGTNCAPLIADLFLFC